MTKSYVIYLECDTEIDTCALENNDLLVNDNEVRESVISKTPARGAIARSPSHSIHSK